MISPDHLVDQARLLASRGKRPRQADLKRAISTLYYALFHAVARSCADVLIGATRRGRAAWLRVYRAIDHGKARQEFKRLVQEEKSEPVALLALSYVRLQELRHAADYDPSPSNLSRREVVARIELTVATLEAIDQISPDEWRDLATLLPFKDRR